jgi:hypothetical protein
LIGCPIDCLVLSLMRGDTYKRIYRSTLRNLPLIVHRKRRSDSVLSGTRENGSVSWGG